MIYASVCIVSLAARFLVVRWGKSAQAYTHHPPSHGRKKGPYLPEVQPCSVGTGDAKQKRRKKKTPQTFPSESVNVFFLFGCYFRQRERIDENYLPLTFHSTVGREEESYISFMFCESISNDSLNSSRNGKMVLLKVLKLNYLFLSKQTCAQWV